ncbi:MAG TPA: PQQ-binding-like beta-propeller repeat protein [Gemmataceae bacterium]|nr:PQQ-binding-like beta-propeller repeat protein [Gemmataceae bacterium]
MRKMDARVRCFLGMVLLLAAACWAPAGPVPTEEELLARVTLSGESPRTARRLAGADKLAEQGKWSEALDEYQQILAEEANDLVPLDARHALQARHLCHLRIAVLPPEAIKLYRARVDGQAKKWLDQGTASHDQALLRRVVEEAFCSRPSEQALNILGDLAFERGDFDDAERWWRTIALPALGKDKPRRVKDELVYPDPESDLARVRAKQILARLFRGERRDLQQQLEAFQALHGKAQGRLAGRDGNYAATLQTFAEQGAALVGSLASDSWTTFAGDSSRNYPLPRAEGRLARLPHLDGPAWRVRLDTGTLVPGNADDAPSPGRVLSSFDAGRSLAFYPIIVGNKVLVAGNRSVTAFDLLTGRRSFHYDLPAARLDGETDLSLKVPTLPDMTYTLTATDERVYARLGAQSIGAFKAGTIDNYLVCLNLEGAPAGRERWAVKARSPDGGQAFFEGAPIVLEGRVYIAATRLEGTQAKTFVCCYNGASGVLRWQRDICETQEFKPNERRVRQHLLTLAGPNVVYCSHSGAIVALDAASGRHAWAVRYPSRGLKTANGDPSPRSLVPCLYAAGRVIAAPLDLDRILCLDAVTGHLLWESLPLEAVHLLGATRGRLILTAATPRKCIRALDLVTGDSLRSWFRPADEGDVPPFGRGLLAGDWVFWPTRDGLHILNLKDAEPTYFDADIRGNLAAAQGCLIVAGIKELSAYIPAGRLLPQRQEDATQNPTSAPVRFRLAEAEADAGLWPQATQDFRRVESLAGPAESYHGVRLRDLARRSRHDLVVSTAEQARIEGRWQLAAQLLAQGAAKEFQVTERLIALGKLAALWEMAGQPARALAAWQSILEDSALSHGQIAASDGLLQPATILAAERIDALIRVHGREIYQSFEQEADGILAGAAADKRREVLGRLSREFPNALVTKHALLELGHLCEEAGQAGAAAHAFRSFLRLEKQGGGRSGAFAGLARAYELLHCWSKARDAWLQLAKEQNDPRQTARDEVAQRLQKPEYRTIGTSQLPDPPLPLYRVWNSSSGPRMPPEDDQQSFADSILPAVDDSLALSLDAKAVLCRSAITGTLIWRRCLSFQPSWIECCAGMVLVAGADGVQAYQREDGSEVWSWLPSPDVEGAVVDHVPPRLSNFQVAGLRLFFQQDQRRLLALDIDTGQVLWSFWAPAGRLGHSYPGGRLSGRYHAGNDGVLIQTTSGKQFVLDARNGRTLGESDKARNHWAPSFLTAEGSRVILARDVGHVSAWDLATGKEMWCSALEWPDSLVGQAPELLGTRTALLVLTRHNYGTYLECFDPATGIRQWPAGRFLGVRPVELEGGAMDERAAYFTMDGALCAYSLNEGKVLWRYHLPGSAVHWRTARTANYLFTYPCGSKAIQVQGSWLSKHLELKAMLPVREEYHPVLVLDAKTGSLVQRLNFPAALPKLSLCDNRSAAFVPFPSVGIQRVIVEEPAPTLHVSEHGLTWAFQGSAWGLNGEGRSWSIK